MGLDMEMMALLLRQYFRVHRLDDPLTAADVPSDRFVQFDEHYIIEFQHHDAILQPLVDFLEEVFERDYTYFTALMEEIYWSVEAELEEEAYQFRRARLNDRGFPDFFEAQDVFAYVNPRDFLKIRAGLHRADARRPAARRRTGAARDGAGAGRHRPLAIQHRPDGRVRRARPAPVAERNGAWSSNQVLVASAVDFGDLDAVRVGGRDDASLPQPGTGVSGRRRAQQCDRTSARHPPQTALPARREPDDRSCASAPSR